MAASFTMRQGDTAPDLTATLTDASGNPANLAGATVVMHMVDGTGAPVVLGGTCTVVGDGTAGKVTYTWVAADTATVTGPDGWPIEFQVTYTDGKILTFPNGEENPTVEITPQLA